MAVIEINYAELERAADAAAEYRRQLERLMNSSNQEMQQIGHIWTGPDSAETLRIWNTEMQEGSRYKKMVKALESYEQYIRCMERTYQAAQAAAVERARWLGVF
ncbi:MAG: hypothetical protein K5705_01345 [Oscillospiraceae bacterium]|nr:hypothetical protein [Oscillospiraceae bacterium]MCR4758912.1 hypothetical protein [Oscillospiraceae bacterium]